MGRAQRPITSADVAQLAGVSRATVSYVLNRVPHRTISPATVERVRDAAHTLGYVPHSMARSLRAGRSDLVLIPQPALAPSVPLDTLMREMAVHLRELGYTVVIHTDQTASGVAGARAWAALRPAGLIVQTARLTAAGVEALRRAGTTAILGWGWRPCDLVPTLVNDHSRIGEHAAEYLLQRGHRHIAAVVPSAPDLRPMGMERYSGVERVAEQHGLTLERVDLDFNEQAAAAVVSGWLQRGDRPTAIFTYNDEFALLLMRAIQDAGLQVPGDIALVGADDTPLCTLLRPRLTSVHLEGSHSGRTFAETLHCMIRGEELELVAVDLLQSRVVPRESA